MEVVNWWVKFSNILQLQQFCCQWCHCQVGTCMGFVKMPGMSLEYHAWDQIHFMKVIGSIHQSSIQKSVLFKMWNRSLCVHNVCVLVELIVFVFYISSNDVCSLSDNQWRPFVLLHYQEKSSEEWSVGE